MSANEISAAKLDLDSFDYELPEHCIAQEPLERRDASRLMVLPRNQPGADLQHSTIDQLLSYLKPGDLLVANRTRVLTARLRGRKSGAGQAGQVEALLLGPTSAEIASTSNFPCARALVRSSGRQRIGQKFCFTRGAENCDAEIIAIHEQGEVTLSFSGSSRHDSNENALPYSLGEAPLPPYIRRKSEQALDYERYQTVFAQEAGSVAAPTAGLHFTPRLIESLREAGIGWTEVVLHVGLGTFRPLQNEDLQRGSLHSETFVLPESAADAFNKTRASQGRVIAVGTTSARVLESQISSDGQMQSCSGQTDLFLYPGKKFLAIDGLLTNFHLPRSSLLLLVAAFAGRERTLQAYETAIQEGYRFYSYGDAMLVL